MLYLLKSHLIGNKCVYKIGYASNINKRFSQYKSHNPGILLLATRPGDKELEKLIHDAFHYLKLNIDGFGFEWYQDKFEIYQYFHKNIEFYKKYASLYRKIMILKEQEKEEKLNRLKTLESAISDPDLPDFVKKVVDGFIKSKEFTVNMKTVCDFIRNYPDYYKNNYSNLSIIIPNRILNYINQLGIDKIKNLKYREASLAIEVNNLSILKTLHIGDYLQSNSLYTSGNLKDILQKIYSDNNINRVPKISDLNQWFNMDYVITKKDGKSVRLIKLSQK